MSDGNKDSAIAKLIETVARGTGVLYEPTHIRRMAKAKADEIRIIGKAMEESLNLPVKYENGNINISTEDYNGLVERTSQRLIVQEMVKQVNIDTVISMASKVMDSVSVVSSKPVDLAWSSMLFNSIGYINDPMLQELWAEILASEVIKPGQTSRRTLEVVRRLSVEEAVIFEKVAEYVIYMEDVKNGVVDYFIPQDDSVLETVGISSVDMIRLEDAGLIANSVNVVENFTLRKCDKKEIYAGNDEIVVTVINNDKKDRSFRKNIYLLSEAGREVYNVVHRRKVDTGKSDYYKAVEKYFYRDDLAELLNGINEL